MKNRCRRFHGALLATPTCLRRALSPWLKRRKTPRTRLSIDAAKSSPESTTDTTKNIFRKQEEEKIEAQMRPHALTPPISTPPPFSPPFFSSFSFFFFISFSPFGEGGGRARRRWRRRSRRPVAPPTELAELVAASATEAVRGLVVGGEVEAVGPQPRPAAVPEGAPAANPRAANWQPGSEGLTGRKLVHGDGGSGVGGGLKSN